MYTLDISSFYVFSIYVYALYISINERNVDTTELTRLPHSLVTNVNKT